MEQKLQMGNVEDDDDLDALRMAALQTLKKKAANNEHQLNLSHSYPPGNAGHFSPRGMAKKAKFGRLPANRVQRNGQYNGWTRNTNLISVPMVQNPGDESEKCDIPKLILPQHRYCTKADDEEDDHSNEAGSKFDRYNNSDSDSDSDDENIQKSPLKRSNSLEALMAELENEIQGKQAPQENALKDEEKVKKAKKRKVSEEIAPKTEEIEPVIEETALKENLQPAVAPIEPPNNNNTKQWTKTSTKSHFFGQKKIRNGGAAIPPPNCLQTPTIPQIMPTYASNFFYNPPNPVFMPEIYPQTIVQAILPPPLVINTDFAPPPANLEQLSPRSAAFVLENRAIIEKRKRKSWSRSPSPKYRVKSPRFGSLSPKRPFVFEKRRKSLSPSPAPEKSVKHRLGTKKEEVEAVKVDPVLEARRKKFEKSEIGAKEGVIKLKKEEIEEKAAENEEKDELFDDETILLDYAIDPLFSDEESDSDNEGRFKTKTESSEKVAILPFRKLVNNKPEVRHRIKREERERERRKRRKSRTPVLKTTKSRKQEEMKPKAARSVTKWPNKQEKEEVKERISERKVEVSPGKMAKTETIEIVDDSTEGDLRAQLSRKRAERQSKHPAPEMVPSRLLQTALQSVGVRKAKKNPKKEEATVEGKLPIRLRLGTSNASEGFGKRKHKKGSLEQV